VQVKTSCYLNLKGKFRKWNVEGERPKKGRANTLSCDEGNLNLNGENNLANFQRGTGKRRVSRLTSDTTSGEEWLVQFPERRA
jgi:hypothetical protein